MVDSTWNRLSLMMQNGQITDSERVSLLLNAGLDMLNQQFGMITRLQGDCLTIQYATNASWLGADFAVSESLDQFVLRDRQLFALDDTRVVPWTQYGIIEPLRFGAYLGAPITIHGMIYGIIAFGSDRAYTRLFNDQELACLQMMASSVRSLLVAS